LPTKPSVIYHNFSDITKVGKVGKVVFVYHSCDLKSKKCGKSQSILLFYAFLINLSQRLPKSILQIDGNFI
jgi:hypothetical protein